MTIKLQMMNKIIWILLGALMWVSCDKEDDLTPSGKRDDYFTLSPADTVNNPLNALRYRFYEKNNVHLMFNDTLRQEDRGTYADGTPYKYTEVIDFSYSMEGAPGNYDWEYVTDFEEQKKSAEFLDEYILPHLGGTMSPYSVFLVKDLKKDNNAQDYYSGMRCFVLNVSGMLELEEDEEIAEYSNVLFHNIMLSKFNTMQYDDEGKKAFEEFGSFSKNYYGKYLNTFEQWKTKDPTDEELWEIGVFRFVNAGWFGKFILTEHADRLDYLEKIFYWKEDVSFEEYYAEYPIVLKKYAALKKVVEDLGYKFNVE